MQCRGTGLTVRVCPDDVWLGAQLLALYSERAAADGSDEWDDFEKDKRMAGILDELRLLIINLHS